MKPHKILITGTFESGKTELIKLFIDDPRVFVIPEAARDILSLDPSLQNKPEFQDILFRQQIRNEALAEASGKAIILCDRGILDIIAFSSLLGVTVKNEWLLNSFGRYGDIMICNAGDIPYFAGNNQLDNQSFRVNLDAEIRQIVKIFAEIDKTKPMVSELRGTLEARRTFLNRHIDETIAIREGRRHHIEMDL